MCAYNYNGRQSSPISQLICILFEYQVPFKNRAIIDNKRQKSQRIVGNWESKRNCLLAVCRMNTSTHVSYKSAIDKNYQMAGNTVNNHLNEQARGALATSYIGPNFGSIVIDICLPGSACGII